MIIKDIADNYEYAKGECNDMGCKIRLNGMPRNVVLRGEKLVPNSSICDCIVFDGRGGLTVSLIELKSSNLDVDRIKTQLQSAVSESARIIRSLGFSGRYTVFPILLAKSYGQRTQSQSLKQIKIKIANKSCNIQLKICGANLKDLSRHTINPSVKVSSP